MGFRCTTAGDGAGVDGVENAAETLLLALNVAAGAGEEDTSEMTGRAGGVRGAPKAAPRSDARAPGAGAVLGDASESRSTVAVNFGEKGGVRCRAGDAVWLGGCGAGAAGVGAATGLGAGGAAGLGSARGIGGGHAAADGAGVRGRVNTGFTPAGVRAAGGAAARGPGITGRSSPQLTAAPTGINPPQTEQRALIDTLVIFAGSSRKTERHSGQETFI